MKLSTIIEKLVQNGGYGIDTHHHKETRKVYKLQFFVKDEEKLAAVVRVCEDINFDDIELTYREEEKCYVVTAQTSEEVL